MELNPEFGFQILDLLLGGFGVKRGIDKDLTEIVKSGKVENPYRYLGLRKEEN